ncbi:MAG: zinc ribbon domain-containing protein [Acidimicrobiales bacterium]
MCAASSTRPSRSVVWGRHGRQQLSQFSRGTQVRYLAEKTGRDIENLNKFGSTRTCPVCGARNRPCGRDYRCKVCNFTCHRDALGAINILQKAIHGGYVPIGADVVIRVTYLISETTSACHLISTTHTVWCSADRP